MLTASHPSPCYCHPPLSLHPVTDVPPINQSDPPLLASLAANAVVGCSAPACHRSTLPLLSVTRVFHFLCLYCKHSLLLSTFLTTSFYVSLSFFALLFFFFFTKEDASFRRMKSLYMCAYKGAIVHLYVNYGVTISVSSVPLFLNRQRELKGGRTKT